MRIIIPAIFALLFFLGAANRNITPDAVTRATIWNSHEGDPDVLGDGKVPQDADALPFTWKTKGILVFAWEKPRQLEKVADLRRRHRQRLPSSHLSRRALRRDRHPARTQRSANRPDRRECAGSRISGLRFISPPTLQPTTSNYGRWALRSSTKWRSTCTVRTLPVVEKLSWGKIKTG